MFDGPLATVFEKFSLLSTDFQMLVATVGFVLVAAAGVYALYLAWRKYRVAINKI